MATQRQLRRGTAAQNDSFTGAAGETVWDTTDNRMRGHDGSKTGGFPVPNAFDDQNRAFTAKDASGTDTITITLDLAPDAYTTYQTFTFKPQNNNTGAATLNVNTLGAKDIQKYDSSGSLVALAADDLVASKPAVVIYDGTRFILQLDAGTSEPGMELLAVVTASASATLDFESVITSDFSSYLFVFEDIRPATDIRALRMRTSTDNGSSYDNGASDYLWRQDLEHVAGTPTLDETITSGGASSIDLAAKDNQAQTGIGSGAAEGLSGRLWLLGPLGTVMPKRIFGDFLFIGGGGAFLTSHTKAVRDGNGDIDAVRFFMSSGNITSGTIKCYGLKGTI